MRRSFRPYTDTEIGNYAIGGVPLTRAEMEVGVPTVTSTADEIRQARRELEEGSFLVDEHEPESTADTGACARRSLTLPPRTASSSAATAVTERVQRAGEIVSKAAALLDRPGSLVHSQPPTFRQAWDRQMECARHYAKVYVRWPRALWGAVHVLLVKPALNLAEWLAESPARFIVAVVILGAIWLWS